MKFSVLALDYDGTIARDGSLDPDVRSAIAEVRSRGIAVVLVTGRILEELRQMTGGLGFVDAVVAENGAVLAFSSGNSRLIGHPAPPIFLEELRRRGIEFKAGQCVVETDADMGYTSLGGDQRIGATADPRLQPWPPDDASSGNQQRHWPARSTYDAASFASQRNCDWGRGE